MGQTDKYMCAGFDQCKIRLVQKHNNGSREMERVVGNSFRVIHVSDSTGEETVVMARRSGIGRATLTS